MNPTFDPTFLLDEMLGSFAHIINLQLFKKNVGNHVGWSLIVVKLFIQHFLWDWRHFYVGFNVGYICVIMLDENVWRFCANDFSCNFSNFFTWLFVQHFVQQRIWNVGLNVGFICAGLYEQITAETLYRYIDLRQ